MAPLASATGRDVAGTPPLAADVEPGGTAAASAANAHLLAAGGAGVPAANICAMSMDMLLRLPPVPPPEFALAPVVLAEPAVAPGAEPSAPGALASTSLDRVLLARANPSASVSERMSWPPEGAPGRTVDMTAVDGSTK